MSAPVVVTDAEDEIEVALAQLKTSGIRRLPVVREGELVGIITVDDLLVDLTRSLGGLSGPVRIELTEPQREAPLPVSP